MTTNVSMYFAIRAESNGDPDQMVKPPDLDQQCFQEKLNPGLA